jgi:hypothetical protein
MGQEAAAIRTIRQTSAGMYRRIVTSVFASPTSKIWQPAIAPYMFLRVSVPGGCPLTQETRFWTILALIVAIAATWFTYEQLVIARQSVVPALSAGPNKMPNSADMPTRQKIPGNDGENSPEPKAATPTTTEGSAPALASAVSDASYFTEVSTRCISRTLSDALEFLCEKSRGTGAYRRTDPVSYGCSLDLSLKYGFICLQPGGRRVNLGEEPVTLFARANRARSCILDNRIDDSHLRCEEASGSGHYVALDKKEFGCIASSAGETCRGVGGKRIHVPTQGKALLEAPEKYSDEQRYRVFIS